MLEAAEAETWELALEQLFGGDSEEGRALATPGPRARLGNSTESPA